jgi:hypothetical protein
LGRNAVIKVGGGECAERSYPHNFLIKKHLFSRRRCDSGLQKTSEGAGQQRRMCARANSMTQPDECDETRCESESILPSQFFEIRERKETEEGVRRLMLAVLTDAVRCYQVGCDAQMPARKRAFREAERWLFDSTTDGPFSFENVCGALDISPEYLRDMVRRWRARRRRDGSVRAVRRSSVLSVK